MRLFPGLMLLATLAACGSDAVAPSPGSAGRGAQVATPFGGPQMHSRSSVTGLTIGSAHEDVTSDIATVFPNLTLVEVAMLGTQTVRHSDFDFWGELRGTTIGVYGPQGKPAGFACWGSIQYRFSSRGVGQAGCTTSNPMERYDTLLVQGNGSVLWNKHGGASLHSCGRTDIPQPPCWTVETAGLRVEVRAFEAVLSLEVTPAIVPSGAPVQARARVTPDRVGSFPLRPEGASWTWQPDGGAPVSVGCDSLCTLTPTVSGFLSVRALVNGVEQTARKRVKVNNCPPSRDSRGRMDDPDFRKTLDDVLQESAADNNTERWRWAWQLPDGTYGVDNVPPDALRTDCFAGGSIRAPVGLPDGAQVIGIIHTHPVVPNTRWVTCVGRQNSYARAGNLKLDVTPPSAGDLGAWRNAHESSLPESESWRLWVINGGGETFAQGTSDSELQRFARDGNLCYKRRRT